MVSDSEVGPLDSLHVTAHTPLYSIGIVDVCAVLLCDSEVCTNFLVML